MEGPHNLIHGIMDVFLKKYIRSETRRINGSLPGKERVQKRKSGEGRTRGP